MTMITAMGTIMGTGTGMDMDTATDIITREEMLRNLNHISMIRIALPNYPKQQPTKKSRRISTLMLHTFMFWATYL